MQAGLLECRQHVESWQYSTEKITPPARIEKFTLPSLEALQTALLTFLISSQIHHMLHRTKCSTAFTLPFKRTISTFCIGPCIESAVVYFSIMNCKQSHANHRICLLQQTRIRKQYEFTDSMLDCTQISGINVKAHWLQSPALPDSMVGVSISSTIRHEN